MSNVDLTPLPGVCKVNSAYSSSIQMAYNNGKMNIGRFTDMNGARFVAGMPEKIGGWVLAQSSALQGVPRGMKDWRDNNANIYVGIGTSQKLYYYSVALSATTDITPWRQILTGTLTNPLYTNANSAVVKVNHTAHGLKTGDYAMLTSSQAVAVGDITVSGVFNPITVIDANNYDVTFTSAAVNTENGVGGTVSYVYYRITLTNPFTTVNGQTAVTVTHNANGANSGDFVTIAGATAVGGLTLSGEYQISNASANSYTITAASAATSGATGGGTPTFQYDISVGLANTAFAYGYGVGGYSGPQGYGQPSATSTLTLQCRVWTLDHYGQQLLGTYNGGTIYIWDPTIQGRAYPLYNAPASMNASFVTAERFPFALGAGLPMEVQWPDQSNYTNWTPSATNSANANTLQTGAFLVGGLVVRDGVSMVFSNNAAYVFNYSGDSYVYNTTTAGVQCGAVGALAMSVVGGTAYWFGYNELWMWNGAVSAIGTDDIRDFIFTNINTLQLAKCVVSTNVSKKEVFFFYPSLASNEIDSYVIYHVDQGCFSIGAAANGNQLARTSWVDRGLLSNPMASDSNGYLYNQESGTDANGAAMISYVTFSPMDISKGDRRMDLFAFIPDFERQTGNLTLTVNTQTYPDDPLTQYGPYTLSPSDANPRQDLRIGAKLVGYTIESDILGGDWRLGVPRVEVQPAGARR